MSEILGSDLKIKQKGDGYDLVISEKGDLELVEGTENLAQSIVIKIKTRLGEMAHLGHPNFGCSLDMLVGEPNTPRVRNMLKSILTECIERDERIRRILWLNVRTDEYNPNLLHVNIGIEPNFSREIVTLVFPFYLEVE